MAGQVLAIIADLKDFTQKEVIGLGLEVTAILREDTPRDTRWAASNWIPSIGAPVTTPALVGEKATAGEVAQAQARQAEGEASLLGYKLEQGVVFCSNHVDYIEVLNLGTSKQAPLGFVTTAIVKAIHAQGVKAHVG